MLVELAIRDFAIIDEVRVAFEPGLNALTGETGAGKSILIDALGAVLGERTGADVVRTGAKFARIEATFDVSNVANRSALLVILEDLGVEPEDDLLILSREVTAAGRSGARINGRAATATALSRLGSLLVDIHGQSDHLTLLRSDAHLSTLDRYAGTERERDELGALVRNRRAIRQQIDAIVTGARERAQRVDMLRFQLAEIEAADLRLNEDVELTRERAILANAERLATIAAEAQSLLVGGEDAFDPSTVPAVAALRQAWQLIGDLAEIDDGMRGLTLRAEEALDSLEEIAGEVRAYREATETDPKRLEAIEDRLDLIRSIKRKYGASIEEILEYARLSVDELDHLTGGEEGLDGLREREVALARTVGERARSLSRKRRAAGDRLAMDVERAIAELNMGRARFEVSIEQTDDPVGVPFAVDGAPPRTVAVDVNGADRVQFLLAANAGEALKPLARVASGGETARLMLALKSILSVADETPTLVFDEVDVGVGGRSGQVVGEKLAALASDHQVLVISHLPQIAAYADAHFRIAKREQENRTSSTVERIEETERIEELAAMLDGVPITPAARANAVEMLRRASRSAAD